MSRLSRARLLVALLVSAGVLPGCGGPDSLTIEDPWARPTPPNAETGAIYFVVDNGTDVDDRLVSATSAWCDHIEVHTTEWRDDVMAMYPATEDELAIPAGGETVFEPGGLHLMCVDLVRPIVEGEPVEVTIQFELAGETTITAPAEQR